MWFAVFVCVASCVYVTPELPRRVPNPLYSDKEVSDIIGQNRMSVIFICDSTIPESAEKMDWFAEAWIVFHAHTDQFYFAEAFNAQGILQQFQQEGPTIIMSRKGKPWLICPFPTSLHSLLFLCEQFLTQKVVQVESVAQMNAHLGRCPFALLAPPRLIGNAMTARFNVAPYIGAMDLFACDPEMFRDLFQPVGDQMAIFRIEDHVIAPLEPTPDGLFMSVLPVFRKFVQADLDPGNETLAAYIDKELTPDVESLLYDLGVTFPELAVGYVAPNLHHVIEKVLLQKITKLPMFLVFTAEPKAFYPFPDEEVNRETVTEYLRGIVNQTIEKRFHSEDIPKNQTGVVEKLVGRTYQEFLADKDNDLIILYTSVENEATRLAKKVFEEAAEVLVPKGVRFATINAALNSSPVPFPKMHRQPYIRFYPSNDRTTGMPFMHAFTKDDILRFVARLGTKEYHLQLPQKKKAELKREVSDLSKFIQLLPEADQMNVSEYFRQLWIDTESDQFKGEL